MADTSEEVKSFISTASLWKSPERIGEMMGGRVRGTEIDWSVRKEDLGGGGMKKAKALKDYLFLLRPTGSPSFSPRPV